MANGKIILKKLDLMGYTPATQVWFVQNGGGPGSVIVASALRDDARKGHLDCFQHMGMPSYGVRGIEAARAYADRADAGFGFSVEWR
mgnify:CR=1 FL=1